MEDSEQKKLFVGGISWEISEDELKEYFSKYGTVVSCVIAKDRTTGKPRGFAFVSYSETSSFDQALLQQTHLIHGRQVDVRKAIPRNEQQNQLQSRSFNRIDNNFKTKKIFVGGLSANLTEEDFKGYFESFGRITDVVVMHDNMTHRPRGFGFITFDSEDSVEEVMVKNFHELNGKLVEVKRAIPKDLNGNIRSGRNYNNSYHHFNYPNYPPYMNPFMGYPGYNYGGGIYGGGFLPYMGPVGPRGPWNINPGIIGFRGSPLPPMMYLSGPGGPGGPMPLRNVGENVEVQSS